MKNNVLAIAIPTYNRAAVLEENILAMLSEVQDYSIPIYISDDSTDSLTEIMAANLKLTYEYVFYKSNKPSLGHDQNCISTLSYPSEDYIWYLGDSKIINVGGIKRVLSLIENFNPSFIAINSEGRKLNIENQIYIDGNLLLKDLGWHLSMTGVTIYSKGMLSIIKHLDLNKCINFPQIALVFKCFAYVNCSLYWMNEKFILNNNHNPKSYWEKNLFKVFLIDWPNCINNLDSIYFEENKRKAIFAHSKRSGLFNLKSFIVYRYKGFFGWREYNLYSHKLKNHSNVGRLFIIIIVLIPRFAYSLILYLYKKRIKLTFLKGKA